MKISVKVRMLLLGFFLVILVHGLFVLGALTACQNAGTFIIEPLNPFKVECYFPEFVDLNCSANISIDYSGVDYNNWG